MMSGTRQEYKASRKGSAPPRRGEQAPSYFYFVEYSACTIFQFMLSLRLHATLSHIVCATLPRILYRFRFLFACSSQSLFADFWYTPYCICLIIIFIQLHYIVSLSALCASFCSYSHLSPAHRPPQGSYAEVAPRVAALSGLHVQHFSLRFTLAVYSYATNLYATLVFW